MRKVQLHTDFVYHIYNRGTDKRDIFLDESYYNRFISILDHYLNFDYPYSSLQKRLDLALTVNRKKAILDDLERNRITSQVEIISFCLMPNHYHLTLKQLVNNGISEFLHRIGTSYTQYFNIRQKRTGRLFEGSFKAIRVKSDEQLLHLSRYQHINPKKIVSKTEKIISYPWSSMSVYLGKKNDYKFVNPKLVMDFYSSPKKYLDFVLAEVEEGPLRRLSRVAIDDDFGWFREFREEN